MSDLLTRHEIELLLKVSRASLFRIQGSDASFPRPVFLGSSRKLQRWPREAIHAWLESKAKAA